MHRFTRAAVVLFLGIATVGIAPSAHAQKPKPAAPAKAGGKIDLTYIPADAVLAVVAQPRRVMTAPGQELMPVEVITALGMREAGFDPLQIEQAIVIITLPTGSPEPGVAGILHFAAPFDPAGVLPNLTQGAQEAEIDGHKYRRSPSPQMPSVYTPDNRTLIVAPQPLLEKMIAAKNAESPLLTLLSKADTSPDAQLLFSMDASREFAAMALTQVPPVPPPFAPFMKIPDHLSAARVTLNLSSGTFDGQITLIGRNEKSAQELEKLVNQGLEMGRQALMAQMTQNAPQNDDAVQQATMKYVQRVSDSMLNALKPTRDKSRVVVSLSADPKLAGIGVLTGLLLPAVQKTREAAGRMQSQNNLKQIAIAMFMYQDANRKFPSATGAGKDGKPLLSWRVHLLPYLEQDALFHQFHLDEPWDSPNNKPLAARMPKIFEATGSQVAKDGKTVYLTPRGEETMFPANKQIGLAEIMDGTSNTIMIVEASDAKAVIWTKPDDYDVNKNNPGAGLAGLRPGGFSVAMGDGSVRFLPEGIDKQTLWAMFTRAGGEVVAIPDGFESSGRSEATRTEIGVPTTEAPQGPPTERPKLNLKASDRPPLRPAQEAPPTERPKRVPK